MKAGEYTFFAGSRSDAFFFDFDDIKNLFDISGKRNFTEPHLTGKSPWTGVDSSTEANVFSTVLELPTSELAPKPSNAAVGPLGVTVEPIEVRTPEDFGKAFSEISNRGLQGVATSQDGLIYNEQPQMFRLALQHRLPLIGYSREMAFNGALMTYGPNNATMFRRAGAFIDKILKGSKKVGDLPVEQPTKYEWMINMKTAKAIGLDISSAILSRADEVIE